jgi:DNA-binding response OmpR family regulator
MMLALASQCVVLIVEDHPDTADMLARFLNRHGMAAESAGDAATAMDRMRANPPACVILDEGLPGTSGLELFRQMRARAEWRDIPVLFYSGAYDWRKQMEAEALGAKGWFVKGVAGIPKLVEAVAVCCHN